MISFKLSRGEHNKHFPQKWNKRTWLRDWFLRKWEYEVSENLTYMVMRCYDTLPTKVLNTLLFPLVVIYAGLENFKEVCSGYKKMLFQKKYKQGRSDSCHRKNDNELFVLVEQRVRHEEV